MHSFLVRAVVDTNVLVSALINRGKPRTLVLRLLEGHSIILSSEILAELADVMSRDKFKAIKKSRVETFESVLIRGSVIVKPLKMFKGVIVEDPDDEMVLSVAYAGNAEYIVTGDRHLLNLEEFKGIRILKVSEMLEIVERGSY